MSDLLRSALLYKFGGLYLDADVITIRRNHEIAKVSQDLISAVNSTKLGSSVLSFGAGHDFIKASLEELVGYMFFKFCTAFF